METNRTAERAEVGVLGIGRMEPGAVQIPASMICREWAVVKWQEAVEMDLMDEFAVARCGRESVSFLQRSVRLGQTLFFCYSWLQKESV